MIFLENSNIHVSFAAKGAELRSLTHKGTNLNYVWSGNPQYWGKHSPVLFPIVGGLKENTYYYKDQAYTLPRHGFARDQEFQVNQISDHEILFTIQDSEESRKVYPFKFELGLRYRISGATLTCTYEVKNTGTEPLLFSIGGHPAFTVPLATDLQYNDYYLDFNNDQELNYHKIDKDLIDDETAIIELQNARLPLKHELFYEDALVFKTLKSDRISIRTDKQKHGLDFHFSKFPFFGIWSAKDADFVCLEPWCGIADGINHQQQLEEKEGIESLAVGSEWSRSWEVSCY